MRHLPLFLWALLHLSPCTRYHHTWSVHLHPHSDPNEVASQLGMENLGSIGPLAGHYLFRHFSHPRYSEEHSQTVTNYITKHRNIRGAVQQRLLKRVKRSATLQTEYNFNDPLYSNQWYLYGDYNNITGAWEQGVTGRGVVVTILDDGLERTHPDLQANYEPRASTDLNDNDDDPMPRYDMTNENKHGTRCAGEVASLADNHVCGVGAAYHSRIGGIRMLDGDVTDAVEARAIGFNQSFIDIYSASWGPDDDGRTVDGPGSLTVHAFTEGIKNGRDGRGSIFVWASGNGGSNMDNCNCDGYTNSIWTLSIGATSEKGNKPWYAEECSSTLAVTYSSGGSHEKQILSTDLHSKCTEKHTGTSAAAPLAAGIFALVLQANPELTWRDMQYLVVKTSKQKNLQDAEWTTNGVGLDVSHKYGFGVIDAGRLVELAQLWNTLPDQEICLSEETAHEKSIGPGKTEFFKMNVDNCSDKIMFLEHVQSKISIQADSRGDIVLKLTSPSGTETTLLTKRRNDRSSKGFTEWPFLNVHTWGENPTGTWLLSVKNEGTQKMKLTYWQLVLYGTLTLPPLRNEKRKIDNADEHVNVECNRLCDKNFGCSGPGPGDCTACAHYRQQSSNNCVEICGPNEYLDRKGTTCLTHCQASDYANDHGQCQPCHTDCKTCSGPKSNECTSCSGLYHLDVVLRTCVTTCPDKSVLQNSRCEPCNSDCFTCSGTRNDQCLSCQTSLFFKSGRCYQSCPTNFYGDRSSLTCQACSAGCSSCFGPDAHQCSSCEATKYLLKSSCMTSCPDHFYIHQNANLCVECHYSCKTCAGGTTQQCLSCLDSLTFFEGSCLLECPEGFTKSGGVCKPCPEFCTSCAGLSETDCTSCAPSHQLINNTCQPACPTGQYSKHDGCEACPSFCLSCSSSDACLTCPGDRFLYDGGCITECPEAMFKRDKACVPCNKDGSCLSCNEHGQCVKCKKGFTQSEHECVSNCEDGQYWQDGACHQCSGHCSTCTTSSPYSCTSCKDPGTTQKLLDISHQGLVYCEGCSEDCDLCTQQYANYCISCKEGKHLLPDSKTAGRAKCVEVCPDGTHSLTVRGVAQCGPCHDSCRSCTGAEDQSCTSCDSPLLLENGYCKTKCSDSFYPSSDGTTCIQCDNSCKSCRGPGTTSCVACPPTKFLQEASCVESCSSGYFKDGGSCSKCHVTCSECSGKGPSLCSSCIEGFILSENVCTNSCQTGQYNDPYLNVCKPCHVSCTNCTTKGPAKCLSCKVPLVKNYGNSECWPCCSDEVHERCCYCHDGISECTDHYEVFREEGDSAPMFGIKAIVISAIAMVILATGLYFLYQWRAKQRPTYRLLREQDYDDERVAGRLNDAYDYEEGVVAMVHS